MHRILIGIAVFLLLAAPAMAAEEVDVNITIDEIVEFTVNTTLPLTFTYDQYSDFGVVQSLGDVNYDLNVNQGWQVEGIILDGTQNGQTAADWDDTNWTLKVNAVTVDESAPQVVDSDGAAAHRVGADWAVTLNIPWPESQAAPDCTIQLTASAV